MYTQVILLMMHVVVFSGDGVNLSKPELASAAQVHYLSLIQRWDSHEKNIIIKGDFLSDPHSTDLTYIVVPGNRSIAMVHHWVRHAKCAWSSFLFR